MFKPESKRAAKNKIPMDRPTVNRPSRIILFLNTLKYESGTWLFKILTSVFLLSITICITYTKIVIHTNMILENKTYP